MTSRASLLACGALVLVALQPWARAGSDAGAIDAHLARLDGPSAERAVAEISRAGGRVSTQLARLAIHRGDATTALRLLEGAAHEPKADEVRELRAVASGLLHATAGARETRTADGALFLHLQHPADAVLEPLLHETVTAARKVTGDALGFEWKAPTYVVVVRDQQTLAEATGLPYDAARTTGTLAIAKWGRVTMLSPRATEAPFAWRDTVVHELAHLALTAVTADRAPLWLQEGVAKDMEIRWRDADPYDERLPLASIVRAAMGTGEYVPLDKLGPSVAMLPSANAAEVAFAAATLFVRYLRAELGVDGFARYLRLLAEAGPRDDALQRATGRSFPAWHGAWLDLLRQGPAPARARGENVRNAQDGGRRARLARLLVDRGHGDAAVVELERGAATAPRNFEADGGWRTLHALAHERRGDDTALDRVLFGVLPETEPEAPWYRLRARRAEARGELEASRRDRVRVLGREPFGPDAVCEAGRTGPEATLCRAARARRDPGID